MFADVILPLSLPNTYTYSVPMELEAEMGVGQRVIVQFGKKKLYTALVLNIHHNKPEYAQTKPILEIVDNISIVNDFQLKLWQWISAYYMATIGEVMKAAMPAGLKLESDTTLFAGLKPDDDVNITPKEKEILEVVSLQKSIKIEELQDKSGIKNPMRFINSLLKKGLLVSEETMAGGWKPKFETYLALAPDYKNPDEYAKLMNTLQRAPKQLDFLMHYIMIGRELMKRHQMEAIPPIQKSTLMANDNLNWESAKSLTEKGVFVIEKREISRFETSTIITHAIKPLTVAQSLAYEQIKQQFETKQVVLLEGVTGSGKTEIYIHLINEQIEAGKQVLFLVPEIALTSQLTQRLQQVFGRKCAVYHSKYNDSERIEIWHRLLGTTSDEAEEIQIIVGARSSIFLPFSKLGLVIVDEEHESNYKQFDPAPRYHTRDTAIYLAHLHKAVALLGTATPSLESFFNTQLHKYGYVKLAERYKGLEMPNIQFVDTRLATKQKRMHSHFSDILLEAINECLLRKEQVILFQNRRGFAPYSECNACGWVPKCENCDVSLTYHKSGNHHVCHYCGYSMPADGNCKACNAPEMRFKGFGTQKIEDELAIFVPNARIARLDLDATRRKHAHEEIIDKFEKNEIDILVGTQMISKGLNFNKVSLVGILDADAMLNYPDFRAFERSFQLITQVSGRAGRLYKRGNVIIQTSVPEHPVMELVQTYNTDKLIAWQMGERKSYDYPPFSKLIRIAIKSRNEADAHEAALQLKTLLEPNTQYTLLGPEAPTIARLNNLYIRHILLKIPRTAGLANIKNFILEQANYLRRNNRGKAFIQFDVDPF